MNPDNQAPPEEKNADVQYVIDYMSNILSQDRSAVSPEELAHFTYNQMSMKLASASIPPAEMKKPTSIANLLADGSLEDRLRPVIEKSAEPVSGGYDA